MTKIEDVARAIYEGRNGHGCKPWSRLPKAHKHPYVLDALSALHEMRTPSSAMIEAMRDNIGPLIEMWHAAIDAALSEEGR